ncbi:CHASE2 domain-containing protein [Sulfurimonas sp.]|uniref:CHASE2 domain-containing protein n=1 Tax=Sulfurimonas sp. TaxID=2022749 RepID=UPI0035647CE7
MFLPSYLHSIDNRIRDFYFNYRGPSEASSDIVIIDIDEKSIKELGQWPWGRDKFSKILENLTLNGAGIIGLDIVFAEADRTSPKQFAKKWKLDYSKMPDFDLELSKSIANTPTILGYIFDFDKNNNNQKDAPQIPAIFIEKDKTDKEFLPQANGVLTNLEIIQGASYSSGYMNNIPDESGIIRSVPLLIKYDEIVYPSLAFEMYRIATNNKKVKVLYSEAGISGIDLGEQKINTDRFGRLYLNFRGPFKSYKYISAVDVYKNKISKQDVAGKFVLVGTSAYGLLDLRSTPMDSVIAGVEIHANIIDNLLKNDMLVKPSWNELADISIIILISFIVIFIYSRLSLLQLILVFLISLNMVLYFNYYLLFSKYLILNITFPILSLFLSLLGVLGIDYLFESRQKELVKRMLGKKVSPGVMEYLLEHSAEELVSSKELEASIFFSDIRGFTTISETIGSPDKLIHMLNNYMTPMVDNIVSHHGTIDKFIGDAIMAYWNAPVPIKDHADEAVKSAIEQINMLEEINKKIKPVYDVEIGIGIGIHTGVVTAGDMGSEGRSDYTIIGDNVNLASRMEGLTKQYDAQILISKHTYESLKGKYKIRPIDLVEVKGKHKAVEIYEVLASNKLVSDEELELWAEATKLFRDSKVQQAYEIFEKLQSINPCKLYDHYVGRSLHFLENPDIEFTPVLKMTTK